MVCLLGGAACGTSDPEAIGTPPVGDARDRPPEPGATADPEAIGTPPVGDSVGDVVAPDRVVRIVEIDRSALEREGRIRYRVQNVSEREQPDLVWTVTFEFPPDARSGWVRPHVAEVTSEMPLRLVSGGRSELLEAVCPNFERYVEMGTPVVATRLHVQVESPVPTRPRSRDGTRGTIFLSGNIECVGMLEDLHRQESMWIDFENVSQARLPPFEVHAVFTSTKARTPKSGGPALAPGARCRVVLDLRGVDGSDSWFAVKVNYRRL